MKSISLLLFTICIYISGHSQIKDRLNIQPDIVSQLIAQDSIAKLESKIIPIAKTDSINNPWLTEHWNTTVYNPYKKERKTYPFNIVFSDSTYASPIDRKKVITSRYGWRNRRAHKGIDIDLITGDSVRTLFDGKVRYVNYHSGHGKTVVVRHYNGVETAYTHLSKQLVKVNDIVKKGQAVGKGGTTGNARGSHLHLEVSFKGIYIHPEYLFNFNKENTLRSQNIWVTKKWVTPYIHNSKRQSKVTVCNTYDEAIESEKKQEQIYVVKRGDTLSRISSKYQVSITSLCKTNSIKKSSTLKIGQKLVLIQ
jgi:murein DD-endopeptidase MepM/ murein hydrolase activator NlpD